MTLPARRGLSLPMEWRSACKTCRASLPSFRSHWHLKDGIFQMLFLFSHETKSGTWCSCGVCRWFDDRSVRRGSEHFFAITTAAALGQQAQAIRLILLLTATAAWAATASISTQTAVGIQAEALEGRAIITSPAMALLHATKSTNKSRGS